MIRKLLKWLFDRGAMVKDMTMSCGELLMFELFLIGIVFFGCTHP